MFDSIRPHHEALVESYLKASKPDELALSEISAAMVSCRAQVVNALKAEEQADARRKLKTLYEGLTALGEYLEQGIQAADGQNETLR